MSAWQIALLVIGLFLAVNLLIFIILVPHVVFAHTVYRNPRKPRTRECTNLKDPDQVKMFNEGIAWAESFGDKRIPVEITNDKLKLKGEYLDLGYDKCAVILQGRTESLLYSYYFAKPYAELGYNILVIDLRAHGLSDGKYQTGGIKESDDLIAWLHYIEERFHIKSFVLHGICLGGATAVYATAKLEERGYTKIEKVVTDGLFISYFEMFEGNFALFNKKAFPVLHLTFLLARLYTGVSFFKNRPIEAVKKIKCPILFIYSLEDVLCPKKSNDEIYASALNPQSKILFLEHGRHSHVRSQNLESYDNGVKEFIINSQ